MPELFDDELSKVNLKLRDVQSALHQADQGRLAALSDLRVEKSSNGKLRDQVEQLSKELDTSRRLATEAQGRASHAGVLEINLSTALSEVRDVTARAEKAERALAKTRDRLKVCESDLDVASQTLLNREQEFAEAYRLLDAFRQAREAEAVLAGRA